MLFELKYNKNIHIVRGLASIHLPLKHGKNRNIDFQTFIYFRRGKERTQLREKEENQKLILLQGQVKKVNDKK